MADPKYLPLLVAFPVVLLLVVLQFTGKLYIPEGEVHYANMFSHLVLNLFFGGLFFVMLFTLLISVIRFWMDLDSPRRTDPSAARGSIIMAAVAAVMDILLHNKFKECEANKLRYWAHLLVFYGFIGLLITTAIAVIYILLMTMESPPSWVAYPLPWWRPEKFLGNLSAAALLIGLSLMIANRLKGGANVSKTSYTDWLLIVVIATLAVTGVVVEILRYADVSPLAYYVYFVHLVSAFMLLIYLPYSKFAHLVYRMVAMVYSNWITPGRDEENMAVEPVKEAA
jgi:quinone-modifying oxidoreductase subunit QmoC